MDTLGVVNSRGHTPTSSLVFGASRRSDHPSTCTQSWTYFNNDFRDSSRVRNTTHKKRFCAS